MNGEIQKATEKAPKRDVDKESEDQSPVDGINRAGYGDEEEEDEDE